MMNTFTDIINKRAIPGLLIIDADYRLLYANREALEIIFGRPEFATRNASESQRHMPEEIVELCEQLKRKDAIFDSTSSKVPGCEILDATSGNSCSLRVSFINKPAGGGDKQQQHIIVLIEKIVERHEVDLPKAKEDYALSKREVEILECVCRGLTNREIAETKFISQYTVKTISERL